MNDPTNPDTTPNLSDRIYAVLVETCGAPEGQRNSFAYHFDRLDPRRGLEYRFQGRLGFGGKFYADDWDWRVGCYREDETPERIGMMGVANKRLRALRAAECRRRAGERGVGANPYWRG